MRAKLLFLTLAVLTANAISAQSFFKPVPKPVTHPYGVSNPFATTQAPTTAPGGVVKMQAFRPIVNIAAYAEPGNKLMAGAGISYQYLTWNESNGKYESTLSISGLMFAGGSIAPKTPSEAVDFGAMVGFKNNLINIGVIPPITSKNWQAVISVGISLNN